MSDQISRQMAIDALCKRCDLVSDNEPCTEECNDIKILKLLPSTQPERNGLTKDDIETIRIHLGAIKENLCNQRRWKEAQEYENLIKRLLSASSVQPVDKDINVPINDTINRQAAIDALGEEPLMWCDTEVEITARAQWRQDRDAIQSMPSAQPERKKGKWRLADIQNPNDKANGNYLYFCSNCFHADLHAKTKEVPYCWYCGAEMEVEG